MDDCPSQDQLRCLLDEHLDPAEVDELAIHLEVCARCQDFLDTLTLSGAWKSTLRDLPGGAGHEDDLAEAASLTVEVADQSNCDVTCSKIAEGGGALDSPGAGSDGPHVESSKADPARTVTGSGSQEETDLVQAHGGLPSASLVPGYEILGRLGEGGMGVVYKARQKGLNRLVALKTIRGGSHALPEHLARLPIEAEAVARLRHSNILQIYEIGQVDGLPFMSLELLEGGTLASRLAGTPQPGRPSAELVRVLAQAIHAAHQAGIVHRDLKPSNVLFSADGVPKITDFGLAKRLEAENVQTLTGQVMGTPSYMAPEQARGQTKAVGPAADIYALGAILYEMLTGRPPFKGESPTETIRQVIDDDPVAPTRLVPRVPRDLETICLKCLSKEPAKRYETAEDLADDLARYLDGMSIFARRTPPWERGAKWARRRPLAAAALGAGAMLFFGVTLGGFVYERHERLRQADRNDWVHNQENDGNRAIDLARGSQSLKSLQSVQLELTKIEERVGSAPELRLLRARIKTALDEVKDRSHELESREAVRAKERNDRDRFARFRALVNEALFHDTQFTGLDQSSNRDASRRAAEAALGLYAKTPAAADASWSLGPLPTILSAAEQAEVTEGCYVLLLVLAESENTPQQGRQRLDEAAQLRAPTSAYHLARVSNLARAGDAAGAERSRLEAARLPATAAFDQFLAGQERFKRRDYVGAFRAFDAALQSQPDHFWAQCLSALCLLQKLPAEPVEAKSRLQACLQRDRDSPWLYLLRGFASYQIASNLLKLAGGSSPRGDQLRADADLHFANAESDYRRALDLLDRRPNGMLRYLVLHNRGVLRLERGDLEEAESDFRQAVELDGRHYLAYASLAAALQKEGKYDSAAQQFGLAIERQPKMAALYRGQAGVVLARKDSSAPERASALRDLDQAIRLENPANPVLASDHTNRGQLLMLEHRDAEALAAFEAAVRIVPDYQEAHRLALNLLLGLKRYHDVVRSCDALVARGKPAAATFELRGLARAELKDFAGAIEDLTSALALRPDRADLLTRRGLLYIVADAPRLALHDFEAAIRLDPASGDAYNGRGAARLRLGEYREAVADAERALTSGEPTAQRFYNAARVYALAAVTAAAEVRKAGRESVSLVAKYQDRAVALVIEAVNRRPAAEQSSFINDVVLADPELRTLRRRISLLEPAGTAAPKARTGPGSGAAAKPASEETKPTTE
jgi:serine/threonine protein kinase/tetratricopeptide (TPR) repeat protein